jgi:hypothetical protein
MSLLECVVNRQKGILVGQVTNADTRNGSVIKNLKQTEMQRLVGNTGKRKRMTPGK